MPYNILLVDDDADLLEELGDSLGAAGAVLQQIMQSKVISRDLPTRGQCGWGFFRSDSGWGSLNRKRYGQS